MANWLCHLLLLDPSWLYCNSFMFICYTVASKTKMSDPIAIKTNGAAPGEKKSFSYVQYIHYSYSVAGVHNGLLKLGNKIRIIT